MIRHELIKATEEFLKQKFDHATEFEQPDIAYRIEHTYRVANIGREIALKEGFDETEMVIACLLHDVSYCEATGEGRFWPTVREHGRRSAQIARPFLEELGLPKDRIEDICYGIAIHVDGKADFPGEETPFAPLGRNGIRRVDDGVSGKAFCGETGVCGKAACQPAPLEGRTDRHKDSR